MHRFKSVLLGATTNVACASSSAGSFPPVATALCSSLRVTMSRLIHTFLSCPLRLLVALSISARLSFNAPIPAGASPSGMAGRSSRGRKRHWERVRKWGFYRQLRRSELPHTN